MKRTLMRLLTISCLLAAGSLNSVAQEKEPRRDEAKVPPDGTFKILAPMPPKIAIGKVVKGAPYSAKAITEMIQTLSDGNQIIRKNEQKLYRDSEGRTRIEQALETIGKWASSGEPQLHIFIHDPVAGVSYNLDPRTHTAHKTVYTQKKRPATGAQAETLMINGQKVTTYTIDGKTVTHAEFEAFAEAVGKKKRAQAEIVEKEIKEASDNPALKKKLEMVKAGKPEAGQRKTEALGTQTIEGVTAEGTRATHTIPAGEIGNTLPIEIVDETWYSPELQINVMNKRRDPRSGETTYRLTNLSRSEPDRSLFEVPADYNVSEGKKPPTSKPMKEEE